MTTPFDHKVWSQPRWLHYAGGVFLALTGIAIRMEINPLVGDRIPYGLVLIPVAIAAYAGGFWPGMVTSFTGLIGALVLFVLPYQPNRPLTVIDTIQFALTFTICLFICVIAGRLRNSAMRNSRLREQMTLENAQVRDVLESITDAFCAVDKDWIIVQANPAFAVLVNQADQGVLGKPIWELFASADVTGLQSELAVALKQRTTRQMEWQSPQSKHWYMIRAFPTALGLSVFLHDISARKQLEESRERMLANERQARSNAEEASRLKEEFLATVSHELRTPMTSLVGWAEILNGSDVQPDRLKEGLASIERSAKAQAKLVDELLDISRITAGKLKIDISFCMLSELADEAVRIHQPAATAKDIKISFVDESADAIVRVDATRIHQVLSNLISNAIKFTPKGGNVKVTVSSNAATTSVRVEDTGEGVTEDFLPHIFERFRQANATTSRRHGGLGLGLAISKQLVELHGGTIEATSDGIGRGSAFTVLLPTATMSGSNFNPALAVEDQLALQGRRIIVVDDDDATRLLITRILEDRGATVTSASDALSGFALLNTFNPDIMISDIGMPDVDGYALARMIRDRHDDYSQVPLIAVTAFARESDRSSAKLAGFNTLITKPVNTPQLIRAISEHLPALNGA